MKNAPSPKQKDLLGFIETYQKENKVMPTFVEMAQKFEISLSGVQQRLDALKRKKLIERKNIYIIK